MLPPEDVVVRVAKHVLETLAFLLEMPDGDAGPDVAPRARATVRFEGPVCGTFSLSLPTRVLPELTANMLGGPEGAAAPEAQQLDALGELANVICGNLVHELLNPPGVFRLAAPRVEAQASSPSTTAVSGGETRSVRIPLDGGAAEVTLTLEPAAARRPATAAAGRRASAMTKDRC